MQCLHMMEMEILWHRRCIHIQIVITDPYLLLTIHSLMLHNLTQLSQWFIFNRWGVNKYLGFLCHQMQHLKSLSLLMQNNIMAY
ncbi:unnamed protein product [Cuscuta campestris]|uniref:Uncharacterized protein n=1 Tax=Cuscuta campestris TaxID=132261 RepID=A0A484MZ80_9ASTE|nr:unnamed protein product [Cuscuta campestris]